MNTPACSCLPKQQGPDESTTTFNLEPKLPDPCTIFNLQSAGMKPKLPDPSTAFQVEEAGMGPHEVPEACTKKIKLEADNMAPKPEPCEEENAPLLHDGSESEITPLSGKHPFFSTVLIPSYLQKKFQFYIPTRFQRHLPESRVPAVLLCGGRSWTTSYCGDLKVKKFDVASWREFAVDNRLRVGDACVFELISDSGEAGEASRSSSMNGKALVFKVQVLRGDLPEEVASRGATSDEPLVIVD